MMCFVRKCFVVVIISPVWPTCCVEASVEAEGEAEAVGEVGSLGSMLGLRM